MALGRVYKMECTGCGLKDISAIPWATCPVCGEPWKIIQEWASSLYADPEAKGSFKGLD